MKKGHILFSILFIGLTFQANAQSQKPKAPVKKPIATAPSSTTKKLEQDAPKAIEKPIAPILVEERVVANKKITFALIAGLQQNSLLLHQKSEGLAGTLSFVGIGFNVGGTINISVGNNFSVRPQLLFSSKSTSFTEKNKFNLLTVDLPIHFLYQQQNFYMGIGPNIAYGISADHTTTVNEEEKYDLYTDDASPLINKYKRLEVSASLLMGYEFKNGISVNTSYCRGLSNMMVAKDDPNFTIDKINTSILSIGIGYSFGKK